MSPISLSISHKECMARVERDAHATSYPFGLKPYSVRLWELHPTAYTHKRFRTLFNPNKISGPSMGLYFYIILLGEDPYVTLTQGHLKHGMQVYGIIPNDRLIAVSWRSSHCHYAPCIQRTDSGVGRRPFTTDEVLVFLKASRPLARLNVSHDIFDFCVGWKTSDSL